MAMFAGIGYGDVSVNEIARRAPAHEEEGCREGFPVGCGIVISGGLSSSAAPQSSIPVHGLSPLYKKLPLVIDRFLIYSAARRSALSAPRLRCRRND